MSISDFIEIGEDGEYVFDVAYLRDGSDFKLIDNGTKICLSEYYRGCKLFDLIVDANATVYALKTLIAEHTKDDFNLLVDGEKRR